MKAKILVSLLLFMTTVEVLAQSTLSWEEFMQQMADEGMDEADEQEWEA